MLTGGSPRVLVVLYQVLAQEKDGSVVSELEQILDLHTPYYKAVFEALATQADKGAYARVFYIYYGRVSHLAEYGYATEANILALGIAHEIGHYRKGHVPKMLAWSAVSLFGGLWVIAWLAKQSWFYRAFGFEPGNIGPALLLCGLLSNAVTFWLSPLQNFWSRRYEYEADAFAAKTLGQSHWLIGALRKLNEKNLGNLTPHPIYSGFYYTHPTLREREQALARFAG